MLQNLSFKSSLRSSSWIVLGSLLLSPLVNAVESLHLSVKEESALGEESIVTNTSPRANIPTQTEGSVSPFEIAELVKYIESFLTERKDKKALSYTSKFIYEAMNIEKFEALGLVQQQMSEKNQELSQEDKEYIRKIYGKEVSCVHHAHKVLQFIENYKKKLEEHNKCMEFKKTLPMHTGPGIFNPYLHYANLAHWQPNQYPQYRFLDEGTALQKNKRFYQSLIDKKVPTSHLRTMMTYFSSLSPETIQRFAAIPAEQFDVMAREWNTIEDIFPRLWYIQRGRFEEKVIFFAPLQPNVIDALARNYRRIVGTELDSDDILTKLSTLSAERLDALGRNFMDIYQSLFGTPKPNDYDKNVNRSEAIATLSTFSAPQLDCMGRYSSTLFLKKGLYFKGEPLDDDAQKNYALVYQSKRVNWEKQLELLKHYAPEKIEALARTLKSIFSAFKLRTSDKIDLLKIIKDFSVDDLNMLGDNIEDIARIYPELHSSHHLSSNYIEQDLRALLGIFPYFDINVLKENLRKITYIETRQGIIDKLQKFNLKQIEAFKKHRGFLALLNENYYESIYSSLLKILGQLSPKRIDALGEMVKTIQDTQQDKQDNFSSLFSSRQHVCQHFQSCQCPS